MCITVMAPEAKKKGVACDLYPFREDGDEDEMPSKSDLDKTKRKREIKDIPKTKRKSQIPKGYEYEPGEDKKKPAQPDIDPGKQGSVTECFELISNPQRRSEMEWILTQYRPRKFEELIEQILVYEDPKDPHEMEVFPGARMKGADYLWTVTGKRRTGKTTLWRTLIPHIAPMYPYVYVFAQTRFTNAFRKYVPGEAIFKGYNEGVMHALLQEQERKIKVNQRLFDRYSEYEDDNALDLIPNPYVHLLFDDTVAERQVHDSEVLNELAFYGRHYKLSIWVNSQHGHALHPGFRANSDVAVSFQQAQKNQRDTIREEYMNFFPRKCHFDSYFDTYTANRHFLAVQLADISLPWNERLYSGVGDPEVKPLKLGCPEYWRDYEEKKAGADA